MGWVGDGGGGADVVTTGKSYSSTGGADEGAAGAVKAVSLNEGVEDKSHAFSLFLPEESLKLGEEVVTGGGDGCDCRSVCHRLHRASAKE